MISKIIISLLFIIAIFIENQSFAQKTDEINIKCDFSEKTAKIKLLAGKSIDEYKSFFLSNDNLTIIDDKPAKFVLDISGRWKNAGESVINIKNDIVKKIRIGEHPAWKKIVENSEIIENHSPCLRIVLDLKIKEYPPFYKIKKSKEKNVIIITLISMEKGKFNQNDMKGISLDDIYATTISLFRIKRYEEALNRLEYIKNHADESESLKSKAIQLINAIKKLTKNYSLYTTISYKYDDYIQLKPLDSNHYKKKSDYVFTGYFASKFNFINEKNKNFGIGYSHYQTAHNKLKEYDLIGSVLDIYFKSRYKNTTFGFSYLPSYYWVNSEKYLMYHLLKLDLNFKSDIDKNLNTKLSYSYYANNYFQDDGRDGHINDLSMNVSYNIGNQKGSVFGGIGLEDNSSSDSNYSFAKLKTNLGFSYELPFEINLALTGYLSRKKYFRIDSFFNTKRRDSEFFSTISLSRNIFYDWLLLQVEYDYTLNNSNTDIFDYEKNGLSISFGAEY